jgi:hypothetical protein
MDSTKDQSATRSANKVALTFDQYKILLDRKRRANGRSVKYGDLIRQWGIKHYHASTAVYRGIKQYDYRIWREEQPI